jgi:hypothetical protein
MAIQGTAVKEPTNDADELYILVRAGGCWGTGPTGFPGGGHAKTSRVVLRCVAAGPLIEPPPRDGEVR